MSVKVVVLGAIGLSALLWGWAGATSAQQATEQFIPLGQSPGLSGKATIIGKVEANDPREQTITIAGATGRWQAKVTERTKIWLDRTKQGQPNGKGKFADLRPGLTVEVKPDNQARASAGGPAEWIKIQVPAP